jgi:lipid A 3-O-deacylase
MGMKWFNGSLVAAAVMAGTFAASSAEAGKMYDMRLFLNQSHPFAGGSQPAPAQPAYQQPAYQPTPVAVTPSASAPVPATPANEPDTAAAPVAKPAASKPGQDGIFSEVRAGVFWHDIGPFGSHKEEGYDGNLEILFTSPDFMEVVWAPRPHLGITVNNSGHTSQAYFGLTWEWDIWEGIFGGVSWGGSVHNGKTRTMELDRKELGCRLLFRESFYLGYRFTDHHNVQLHLDHISNAKLCDTNEGLDNFGIRYGYLF